MLRSQTPNMARYAHEMKLLLVALLFLLTNGAMAANPSPEFDAVAAERFARLALACVDKEYPNKISHVLNSDADVAPPRKLTPVFLRLLRLAFVSPRALAARPARAHFSRRAVRGAARDALRKSLTAENLKQRGGLFRGEGDRTSSVRMGWPGCSSSARSCASGTTPEAREMSANLRPLEEAALERLTVWLPKLSHPVRIGEHAQTAFALGLMLDYARAVKNEDVRQTTRRSGAKVLPRGQETARWPTSHRAKISSRPASPRPMRCGACFRLTTSRNG